MTHVASWWFWWFDKRGYFAYLALIATVTFGLMNVVHNLTYKQPTDGAAWAFENGHLRVKDLDLEADSGLQIGDELLGINDLEITDLDVYEDFIHSAHIGGKYLYLLNREGASFEPWIQIRGVRGKLEIAYYFSVLTGFIYIIFLFLVLNRELELEGKAILVAFGLAVYFNFVFHHTNRFALIDWASYYFDQIGGLALPSAFLAYALHRSYRGARWLPFLQAIHILVSLALLILMLYWIPQITGDDLSTGQSYFTRIRALQGTWAASLFCLGFVAQLFSSRIRRRDPLSLLFWPLAWAPYAFTLFGFSLPFSEIFAAAAPIMLPFYAIFELSRRGELFLGDLAKNLIVYVSVVLILILEYILFVKLFQFMSSGPISTNTQTLVSGLGIIFAALSYTPLKHWGSEYLDRLIYGERFEPLKGLLDFSGLNRADTNIEEFLRIILIRTQSAFPVERCTIYRASRDSRLFCSLDQDRPRIQFEETPSELSGGELLRGFQAKTKLADTGHVSPFSSDDYLCPLRVSEHLAALLVLSPKREIRRFSPEELRLLTSLLNQSEVLMENMELYQAIHQKAVSINQLKEYNENIIESSRIGILTTDDLGRTESCNSAFSELVGISKSALIGKTFDELLRLQSLSNERQVRFGFSSEGEFVNPQNKRLLLEIQRNPLRTKENEVYGTLYMVEDIREKKQIYQKLTQQEKLASIGLLAAGIAHEINTPLTGIASYSQLLGSDPHLDPDNRELVGLIQAQGQRAANIVSSLLNFSRKEQGPRGPVDLSAVLQQTLRFLSHQTQKTGVAIEVQEAHDPPRIEGYANQMQQVFVNLIVNALDAMPKGGRLTIAFESKKGSVEVTVSDTGHGMDAETKRKIFDPFFTTKEVGKGTGLGLAVVYNILQDHGAAVEVESAPGKGTTFRIAFPTPQGEEGA